MAGLLLDEVDTAERPAERWDETVARIAWSMRSMAVRHSRSFPHVVNASISEPPLGPFFARIERLHAEQRVPRESPARIGSVIHAFVAGHILSAISHPRSAAQSAIARPRTRLRQSFRHQKTTSGMESRSCSPDYAAWIRPSSSEPCGCTSS